MKIARTTEGTVTPTGDTTKLCCQLMRNAGIIEETTLQGVTNMDTDSFEYRCPLVAQKLFQVMEEILTDAGYLHQQGLWTGSAKSTNGNFVVGRQHSTTKQFRLVWYNHVTGFLTMKDLKGKKSFESMNEKACQELGLW